MLIGPGVENDAIGALRAALRVARIVEQFVPFTGFFRIEHTLEPVLGVQPCGGRVAANDRDRTVDGRVGSALAKALLKRESRAFSRSRYRGFARASLPGPDGARESWDPA
jgi:hypothetical protein